MAEITPEQLEEIKRLTGKNSPLSDFSLAAVEALARTLETREGEARWYHNELLRLREQLEEAQKAVRS